MEINDFLSRLDKVRGSGTQFSARCPAHDDRANSLSVTTGKDGRILVHCHAGCTEKDIVAAMGLKLSDLFADNKSSWEDAKREAEYRYTDDLKKVKWRKPDGDKFCAWYHRNGGSWQKGRTGPAPLYTAGKQIDNYVFLVEGEKDVDNLISQGASAVTLPDGSNSKWLPEYDDALKGKTIVIIPDNDDPGRKYAQMCADHLRDIATVRRLDLASLWPEIPKHGDVSDYLAKGGDVLTLAKAADALPEWTPEPVSDGLPEFVSIAQAAQDPPQRAPVMIHGVLRRGHKMLVTGGSKTGKSFLDMELAIATAEGLDWLGFRCEKGCVLFVNMEIDHASAVNRMLSIYQAKGIDPGDGVTMWSLRGHVLTMEEFADKLISRVKGKNFDMIIIDPIYKLLSGDENSATDMGKFCNQLDRIASETGCAVVYTHHHSKGVQGGKKSMDRASGSGVFARDPDAILDISELVLTPELARAHAEDSGIPLRVEGTLREFAPFDPVDCWFDYPLHVVDGLGELAECGIAGSTQANLTNRNISSAAGRLGKLGAAYDAEAAKGSVTVAGLAARAGVTVKTIRNWLSEFERHYALDGGIVTRKTD